MALSKFEGEQKPAYRLFQIVSKSPTVYSIYSFPTASDIVDYPKHSGESGRSLNVLAIINGKNTFVLTYSNSIESFYKTLPMMDEIIKSILILK